MEELQIINHQGQRVLTTAQLAESYESDEKRISENFNRNQQRYIPGKHYYLLTGSDLEALKGNSAICGIAPSVNRLYLWTEKGAWLHAKSLNTDKAWEAYDKLVDEYYRIKDLVAPSFSQLSPQLQVLNQMLQAMANIEIEQRQIAARLDKSEQTLSAVKETFLQRDENWRQSINLMINRIAHEGRDYREIKSDSYMRLEERAGCNLNQRLRNLKDRLQHEGATKTKVDNVNRLDVIEQDKRLKAIYDTIVKEMALAKV